MTRRMQRCRPRCAFSRRMCRWCFPDSGLFPYDRVSPTPNFGAAHGALAGLVHGCRPILLLHLSERRRRNGCRTRCLRNAWRFPPCVVTDPTIAAINGVCAYCDLVQSPTVTEPGDTRSAVASLTIFHPVTWPRWLDLFGDNAGRRAAALIRTQAHTEKLKLTNVAPVQ